MIKVYFEAKGTLEWVATFADENTYMDCYPMLEKKKIEYGWENITESDSYCHNCSNEEEYDSST